LQYNRHTGVAVASESDDVVAAAGDDDDIDVAKAADVGFCSRLLGDSSVQHRRRMISLK
jgi:hypothetical protein